MPDDKFRSRKFLLICSILGIASVALFTKFLAGAEWAQVATFCGSAYLIGQAYVDSSKG